MEPNNQPNNPLIEVQNVSFSFNGMEVLRDISFTISPGDFVALIGPNGSGKTTLIRMILGIVEAFQGTSRADGAGPG